jgi:hypothetical protein
MSNRLRILLLDKLVLALVLAAATYFFSAQLEGTKSAIDYQRTLFDARRDTYVSVLTMARAARDLAAEFHGGADSTVTKATKELAWRRRLKELSTRRNGMGGGGSTDFGDEGTVLIALDSLERARQRGSLYISAQVDSAIDQFMGQLWEDIDYYHQHGAGRSVNWPGFERAATQRAYDSFATLLDRIRRSLRVEDIILG